MEAQGKGCSNGGSTPASLKGKGVSTPNFPEPMQENKRATGHKGGLPVQMQNASRVSNIPCPRPRTLKSILKQWNNYSNMLDLRGWGLPGHSCCPAHADPQHVRGCRARGEGGSRRRGGGWKEHGSMIPACRGQPVFQTSRSRAPSPTCHVTSPLSARSTRLRSPSCFPDQLPLWCRWF